MDLALFHRFATLAHRRAGISLHEGKLTLVEARVGKRVRALGLSDAGTYLRFLEDDRTGEELVQFLDVITTNFTSFFREPDHFELLRAQLAQCYQAGQRRVRLWSAASSSGEEPYSMAITLLDTLDDPALDARILATDLSSRMLARAQAGHYLEKAVAPVPPALRQRHFSPTGPDPKGNPQVTVSREARALVTFKRLNLAKPPFPMPGPLDVVFCRNVMIYFDQPVRQALITDIERLLKPGGLLLIGHTETLTGIQSRLGTVRPSVYQKPHGASR
ncbi:MAG: methyltransferase domain-containing protein [Deltaproteobacteria bacterium]|nr:methyltransferase domain-containing protein [Deltaproteobacteria bacterium]